MSSPTPSLNFILVLIMGSSLVHPIVVPSAVSNKLSASKKELRNTIEEIFLPPFASPADTLTLRLIVLITRHGSRPPYESYPTNAFPYYDLKFWPEGPGQLTKYGKQQLYRTGLMLRARYADFLSTYYNYNETSVTTNHYDRDFMSAACLLAGLYPPKGYELWNPNLLWQPIPIWHSFDVADLVTYPDLCPRFTAEMDTAVDDLDQNEDVEYDKTFDILTKYSGENVTSILDAFWFYDTFQMNYSCCGSSEALKLFASPVLNPVSDYLNQKANNPSSERKIHIDAAHDITIAGVFNALGITQPFYPRTSSYVVFELHDRNLSDYVVETYFFNDSSTITPTKLNSPNCPSPCLLTTFTQLVQDLTPSNWTEECQTTA